MRRISVYITICLLNIFCLTGCGDNLPVKEVSEEAEVLLGETQEISEEQLSKEIYLLPHYALDSGKTVAEGSMTSEEKAKSMSIKVNVPEGYYLEKTAKQVYQNYELKQEYETYFSTDKTYAITDSWLLVKDDDASEIQLYYGTCETEKWLIEISESGELDGYDEIWTSNTSQGNVIVRKNPEAYKEEEGIKYYEYYVILTTKENNIVIATFTDYHLEDIGQTTEKIYKGLFQ